jgi:hypothetical protein
MRILIGLAAAALLVAPASASLLVIDGYDNGDFENPGFPGAWTGSLQQSHPVWGPGGAKVGLDYGSVQTGGNNPNPYEAQITRIQVPPSEIVTLTGWMAGGTLNQNADIYVQLLDGGVVMDEMRINIPVTYGFGWMPFALVGHTSSGHISVVAGLQLVAPIGWSDGTAIHLDGLELIPEPASLALFALAGLPLLRRRR